MAYRNKIYVSMDADSDIKHYYLMKAWKQSDRTSFNFYDAHDINNIYDKSEESIKAGLRKRFENTKVFILLVGDQTRYLYKYVRWEIEEAIRRDLPCIIVNINGKRSKDSKLCPPIIRDELAVHVSFNAKIIEHALTNWPDYHQKMRNQGKSGAYYYNDDIYKGYGL